MITPVTIIRQLTNAVLSHSRLCYGSIIIVDLYWSIYSDMIMWWQYNRNIASHVLYYSSNTTNIILSAIYTRASYIPWLIHNRAKSSPLSLCNIVNRRNTYTQAINQSKYDSWSNSVVQCDILEIYTGMTFNYCT